MVSKACATSRSWETYRRTIGDSMRGNQISTAFATVSESHQRSFFIWRSSSNSIRDATSVALRVFRCKSLWALALSLPKRPQEDSFNIVQDKSNLWPLPSPAFVSLRRGREGCAAPAPHLLCSILELVRTHFAACGGEEVPRENSERRRSRTADNFKFFFGGYFILLTLTPCLCNSLIPSSFP